MLKGLHARIPQVAAANKIDLLSGEQRTEAMQQAQRQTTEKAKQKNHAAPGVETRREKAIIINSPS